MTARQEPHPPPAQLSHPLLPLATLPAQPPSGTIPLIRHVDALRAGLIRLGGIDDALLDVGREAVEGLLDVDVGLGRDLEEGDAELVGERLAPLRRHHPLLFPVAFVADQDLVHAFGGVLLDVGKPGSDIFEAAEATLASSPNACEIPQTAEVGWAVWGAPRGGKGGECCLTVERPLVRHVVD